MIKNKKYQDSFGGDFEVRGLSTIDHFAAIPLDLLLKLFLMVWCALIPIAIALLPVPAGLIAAGVFLTGAILKCFHFRGTFLEWGVLATSGFVLIAMGLPSVGGGEAHIRNARRKAEWEAKRSHQQVSPVLPTIIEKQR
jgi:hypothetical protein